MLYLKIYDMLHVFFIIILGKWNLLICILWQNSIKHQYLRIKKVRPVSVNKIVIELKKFLPLIIAFCNWLIPSVEVEWCHCQWRIMNLSPLHLNLVNHYFCILKKLSVAIVVRLQNPLLIFWRPNWFIKYKFKWGFGACPQSQC